MFKIRFWFLWVGLLFTGNLFSQEIYITFSENKPYYLNDTLTANIYLHNNSDSTLTYFDSKGPTWSSFKEEWALNVTSQMVEILPLNNNHNSPFNFNTIIDIASTDTHLIRTHKIPLAEIGIYSLSYMQEQGAHVVQKRYADSDSTFKRSQSITHFKVHANVLFEVREKFDTTIRKIINMSWDEWADYRHVKLHSRKKIFRNIDAAFMYPQDVYALEIFCHGMDAEIIKRIGQFKNLRLLSLRNYELNFFPKELANLELYELTLEPKKGIAVKFDYGISKPQSLREFTAKIYGELPPDLLDQKYLTHLKLGDSEFTSLPDLSPLQTLEVFEANNAQLSDLSQMNLHKLPNLKELNLSGNKEINTLTPLLTCYNLEFLTINRTSITEVPDSIEQLKKLKKLSISNKITVVSDSIGNLSDMRYLSFGGNRSLDSIPTSILKMEKLLHFDISSTRIPELPEGIAELPLEKVLIYNTDCKITKDYKALKKRLGEKFRD